MAYWRIGPHKERDYDYCVIPADSEANHKFALEYAQDVLESLWDGIQEDDEVSVTIELCSGDIPDDVIQENPQ